MSSSRLYELIQSLNQSEKRYFKLFMKRYSHNNESSIFGQLFDFLVKTKKYNKEELLQKNQYINPKQLNNIRNRLYKYILLSLRTYNSNTTSNSKIDIYQTMINFEILTSKGLYIEAWKMLVKAEKLAEENEFYQSLKEILDHKRYLANTRIKSKNIKKEIVIIQEKQERVAKIIIYIERFNQIYNELYELFKIEGRVLRDATLVDDIKKELKSYEAHLDDFQSSYQATYLYYYNFRFAFQFTADWKMSNEYANIPLAKYHRFHTFNINKFLEYRRLYTSKIISLNNLYQFEEARNFIQEVKEIPKQYPNDKEIDLIIFEDAFFFELESYIQEFRFEKAIEIIQLNKERIHLLEQQLNSVNQQSKRYRIALSYFGANDFEEALNWTNKIMDLDELKYRKDILSSVQLLNLLIHFELQNFTLVKNKLKSLIAYLDKIDRLLTPEKLLINAIKDIVLSKQNQLISFKDLKEKLEIHFNNNLLDTYFFCYFNITKWIDQKIEKLEVRELVQKTEQ